MTDRPAPHVELAPLVAALGGARALGDLAGTVDGIFYDSRAVRPGSVFVALRGEKVNGHLYIDNALAAGARALVVDEEYARATYGDGSGPPAGVASIVVPNTRRTLSRLAAAFYGYPAHALRVIGITGTNGKTTTAYIVSAMLREAGIPAGIIGTLGARFEGAMWSLDNTTPLAPELHALFAAMRDRGARAVVMEVSSHALALDRVADVTFEAAALTNVTRDHLDFHGDFDSYAAAKRTLFEQARASVFNDDVPLGHRWAEEFRAAGSTAYTYGIEAGDLRATDVDMRADGSSFTLDGARVTTRLPGRFNVSNALAALGLARALDLPRDAAVRALATFERVPGRMEHLAGDGIDVLVDYAHTPDALEVVLGAARETARGALVAVFGCGGDRDRGKRPQMGAIAARLADRVVVTSDNPRTEDPQTIVDDILAGIADTKRVAVDLDRRSAIRQAIAAAKPGDVVVVAGKGHETYQIVGERSQHFDDREEVRAALAARRGTA